MSKLDVQDILQTALSFAKIAHDGIYSAEHEYAMGGDWRKMVDDAKCELARTLIILDRLNCKHGGVFRGETCGNCGEYVK